jgi:hypothetical protein
VWTRLAWVGAALAIALVGLLVYRTLPLLYPAEAVRAPLDPLCDLRRGPCTARFPGGGMVRLGIVPRHIPVLEPLTLTVEVEGLEVSGVELDFAGTDMNMGYNRVRLAPSGPGRFLGEGMLPICVRSRMTWEAKVMLDTPRGLLVAPFRFDTVRRATPGP